VHSLEWESGIHPLLGQAAPKTAMQKAKKDKSREGKGPTAEVENRIFEVHFMSPG
jgi:hypothetical protein